MKWRPFFRAGFRYRGWPWYYFYALGKIGLDPAYAVVVEMLRDSQRPLLDVGCGMGLLGSWLRENGCRTSITGVDLDPNKIALARQAFGPGDGTFLVGDALDLPAHCGDVVLLDVLHYLTDADQLLLLEKVADRMAPGGVALIRSGLNEPNLRFFFTIVEEWFVKFCRWIPTSGWNFPLRNEILVPFAGSEFETTVRPMWGCTPFNSYLFVVRRREKPMTAVDG